MLIKHVQLLCIHERERVEEHVMKPYYPIEECMQICEKNGILSAVARLHIKGGEYMTAIRKYLAILRSTELARLLSDIHKYEQSKQQKQKELCDCKL